MFSHLSEPTLDPILSLSVAYRNDPRQDKVDLGIGVYRNSDGQTPIMKAVAEAQRIVTSEQQTKAYVGLAGCEEFNQSIGKVVFGETPIYDRMSIIQTPGASGGLRMLGDLLNVAAPGTTVWLSNPSYVNHKPVMEAAGLNVKYYRYFNAVTKQVDTDAMLTDISTAGVGDVVLLHGCCHNPTGADITLDDWKQITELSVRNGFVPFVDVAYQGFGDGLEQDAFGLRHMAENVEEMLLTTSCSKNFGLYRERTGAAVVIGKNAKEAANARGKLLTLARSTYTMPPDHGAALVKTILGDEHLTGQWKSELVEMQQRLVSLRDGLCKELKNNHSCDEFDFIMDHKGMFTVLGFSAEQMQRLRVDFGIYGVDDGRINIAGLSEAQLPYVADALISVNQ
ncbi:aromatic amino acid aminotransferase [Vibrio sp. 10N.286.49.C2]|uniref:amino acid aminotransferase n=1 Tax=unclassified Vibrio TaxID=2614977 RepID=UPI000C864AE4|nr:MULTISPECIES: amino acid aminotransferase [unclassified Vibrio]PMH38284.1 aromatic amino acid aminotransferase [Vibrio sp. 10N.286.49.C2]PMH55692.1 aromatic amino acid aminotransferase [Vibrio sp. 10N.286.49.B1]PMH79270.1 aromatic amino acid aminotransferase [Vibrio sp. 10N.286.48.B7]